MNSLATASSSYLRSAMHQPIQWHQWNEEAFATAQREGKPILLDIGAVWCHWCHVMDRESYDDPDVAQIISDNFIAIKVDRDERPDVDSRYQAAVAAISGQGGWPLTAFLTPEGQPFFGGTYFPPLDQNGRPGFKRVLLTLAEAYRTKLSDVMESAQNVMGAISQAEGFSGPGGQVSPRIVDQIAQATMKMFDPQNGGFGSQPKFPHTTAMDLLLDRFVRTGDEDIEKAIVTTLDRMARGGVYDQLGGGFHRYSVDESWIVPHFEKMSYDNSGLLQNYARAFRTFVNPFYAQVARDIVRWMDDWLSDRENGGFYASQDADHSMDDDGDYFTWTLQETRSVLSGSELNAAVHYFDIGELGEMHHDHARNVLHVRATAEQLATRLDTDAANAMRILQSAKDKMYASRKQRPTPYIDKTVYVGWNALCISAYLEAARSLDFNEARQFGLKSLDRILGQAWDGAKLIHVVAYSDPEAPFRHVSGLLDDYVFTVLACLDAYESTTDLSYYNFAAKIADAMIERFFDAAGGGFFDTENDSRTGKLLGALVAPRKPFQDSPTPAGNSLAAVALLRLHGYSGNDTYRGKAEETLAAFAAVAGQYGMFAGSYALAATWYLQPPSQVCVIGEDELSDRLYASALARYTINKPVLHFRRDHIVRENLPPVLAETLPAALVNRERSIAIVCSGFRCFPPVSDPDELVSLLNETITQPALAG